METERFQSIRCRDGKVPLSLHHRCPDPHSNCAAFQRPPSLLISPRLTLLSQRVTATASQSTRMTIPGKAFSTTANPMAGQAAPPPHAIGSHPLTANHLRLMHSCFCHVMLPPQNQHSLQGRWNRLVMLSSPSPLLMISGALIRELPTLSLRNLQVVVSRPRRYTYIKGVLTGPGIEILGDGSRCAAAVARQSLLCRRVVFLSFYFL